ncbi:ATP-binding protein [Streptomyces sp. NPDC047023]|uniref:ATP-binding protein n=1 Tax=Streptomyces sp. NPDC047023 TaxID=3155139 RepID=UPI0033C669AB
MLRDWLLAPPDLVAPVAVVSAHAVRDRQPVLTALADTWSRDGSGTAEWVRITEDQDVRSSLPDPRAALERLLDSVRGGPVLQGRPPRRLLLVDDLDELAGRLARPVEMAARNCAALAEAGVRLVLGVGSDLRYLPEVDDPRALVVSLRHVHPRPQLVERISSWATSPGDDVLLVTGPPGAGKTTLMQETVDTLRADDRVRVAFELLRDWDAPNPPVFTAEKMVRSVAEALGRQGFGYALPEDVVHIVGNVDAQDTAGTITGVSFTGTSITGVAPTVDGLAAQLRRRAFSGEPRTPLLIVVDGLNELELEPGGQDGLRALVAELEQQPRSDPHGPTWGVKILVSSQYRPDWLSPAAVVDLRGPEVDAEIRAYAHDRLSARLDSGQALDAAEAVVRLADGLFIVAHGHLEEWEAGGAVPSAGTARPAGSAVGYYQDRLRRLRESMSGSVVGAEQWEDTERFLTLAALTPQGLTAAEFGTVWQTPAAGEEKSPGHRPWKGGVVAMVANGPARTFLHLPDPADAGDRFRLIHSSVREGVLTPVVAHPRISAARERDRLLSALTPLDGTGAAWDPVDGRLALASALGLITDGIEEALRHPADPEALRRGELLVRRLLEDWQWLTHCTEHAEDPAIPLGMALVVGQLGRLVGLDGFAPAALTLWPDGPVAAPERPAPTEPPASPEPSLPSTPVEPVRTGAAEPDPADDSAADDAHTAAPPARGAHGWSRGARYATVQNPSIRGIIHGSYRHHSRQEALDRLMAIANSFTLSRLYNRELDPERPILWIQGYELTLRDRARNLIGNYARLSVARLGNDRWTLTAEKLETDRPHPKRRRVQQSHHHPNWGHPILRRVLRNQRTDPPAKPYPDITAAQKDLDELQDQYLKTIPSPGELRIMVWDGARKRAGLDAIVRVILTIEALPGTGFVIRASEVPARPGSES